MLMKKGSLFFLLFANLLISCPGTGSSQREYKKNQHVVYELEFSDNKYLITYTFMDQFENLQTYELAMPADFTDEEIDAFGVSKWLLEPYIDNEKNRQIRDRELKKGMFMLVGNSIEVDKSAVIRRYADSFCKPIAKLIVESLEEYGKDNRRDRIEMAIRFVQDIPYGIPQYASAKKHFGGVAPPPALLKNGYGDCDSKVLLFAGILIHLIPGNEILFLDQSDHVLSAIAGDGEEGLTYVLLNGKKYLVAETAGPGRRLLGERGDYFSKKFKAEILDIDFTDPLPYNPGAIAIRPVKQSKPVEKNKVIIINSSEQDFRFQVSLDNASWKEFHLKKNESGTITLQNIDEAFLRFRNKNKKYSIYEIQPGKYYSFRWNIRHESWEPDPDSQQYDP